MQLRSSFSVAPRRTGMFLFREDTLSIAEPCFQAWSQGPLRLNVSRKFVLGLYICKSLDFRKSWTFRGAAGQPELDSPATI